MPYKLHRPSFFERLLKDVLKRYSKAERENEKALDKLRQNPSQGNRYPGFGKLEIRKIRLALKSHGLGKSRGLRIIFLVDKEKQVVCPLLIYAKREIDNEEKVKELIKRTLDFFEIEFS